jgi:hypothetical protein
MVSEAVNAIVILLFGVLLGALDVAMVVTGEAHGLRVEGDRPSRRSGESWWAWQRRIADEQSERTSSVMRGYPAFRFLTWSLVVVGVLIVLVVRYSPLGFRWLPFLGGIFAGMGLMQLVFEGAKRGYLKVSRVGLLDRLVQGDRRPSTQPD